MSDLVERLRVAASSEGDLFWKRNRSAALLDAADRIEALEAEVERLREARIVVETCPNCTRVRARGFSPPAPSPEPGPRSEGEK
jgi:hypothetical protein